MVKRKLILPFILSLQEPLWQQAVLSTETYSMSRLRGWCWVGPGSLMAEMERWGSRCPQASLSLLQGHARKILSVLRTASLSVF